MLSVEEIDRRMEADGFPELRRHWLRFRRRGVTIPSLDRARIERRRHKHMAPLFGSGWVLGALAVASLPAGWSFAQGLPVPDALGASGRTFVALVSSFNVAFVLCYATTQVQRYLAHPMEQIIGEDLAWMLSREDFRAALNSLPGTGFFHERREKLGVNRLWDAPEYLRFYRSTEGAVESLTSQSCGQIVHAILRDFLGAKDPVRRKHEPGRWMHYLRDGKRSVTAFVAKWGEQIRANATESLPEAESIDLLRQLRFHFLQEGAAAERLDRQIDAFTRGDFSPEQSVRVEVWQRNPWRDLTHQEEFFSSASLRGVKVMGRGSKGRLGTFGYLRNPSISALDFGRDGERAVRARLGLVEVRLHGGRTASAVFVEGVEGSNSIAPEVIRLGIEEYARECEVEFVIYHAGVHNRTPRRFVRYLQERCGLACREFTIEYLDSSRREYLDAFGFPFEPWEYAWPKGRVLGMAVRVRSGSEADGPSIGALPSPSARQMQWFRRNAIWCLYAESFAFAGYCMWQTSPVLILGLVLLGGAGTAVQLWHQGRSVRSRSRV